MTVLDILRPLTPHAAQQRGWRYLNRVEGLRHEDRSVTADVVGTDDIYDVELRYDSRHLRVWCSCPYFADRSAGCKHLWATAVLAVEHGWLTNLASTLAVVMDFAGGEDYEFGVLNEDAALTEPATRPTPVAVEAPDWQRALAAVTFKSEELAPATAADSQLLYVLNAPVRGTVAEVSLTLERIDHRRDGTWSRPKREWITSESAAQSTDPDDRWALSLIAGSTSHSQLNGPLLSVLLPRLGPTGRVRLRQSHRNIPAVSADEERPLGWDHGDPWVFTLVVTHEDGGVPRRCRPRPRGLARERAPVRARHGQYRRLRRRRGPVRSGGRICLGRATTRARRAVDSRGVAARPDRVAGTFGRRTRRAARRTAMEGTERCTAVSRDHREAARRARRVSGRSRSRL